MIVASQNNKDRHFKGQYGDEEVIAFFREHWIKLLPEILIFTIIITAFSGFLLSFWRVAALLSYNLFAQILLVSTVAVFSYFIHRFFWKVFSYFLHTVILTNFRIVEVSKTLCVIFIHDSQQTFDMKEIQDIHKQQDGFWRNILRFGNLVIMMSSSDIKIIRYVPNPDYHFRLVNRIKRTYIQQRVHGKLSTHSTIEASVKQSQAQSSLKNFFLSDIVSLNESDSDKSE